ncbi:Hypothetical protein, putative [Bodo saltans]|uniref:Uncharacterized protein n=1 Tax=Bodo saltans TaxID=75058 RepID=A0A0S4KKR7_BODSA|nr:Hypothetical protein, putative [Bodo saltans]|eukprot:CUI15600.1 Hypothetical protein, putative [Bodo saltans]
MICQLFARHQTICFHFPSYSSFPKKNTERAPARMWRAVVVPSRRRYSLLLAPTQHALYNAIRSFHMTTTRFAGIKEFRRQPTISQPLATSSDIFDDILDACDSLENACSSARRMQSTAGEAVVFPEFVRAVHSAMSLSATQLRLAPDNVELLTLTLATLSNASKTLVQRRQAHYRSTTSFLDTKLNQAQQDVASSPYFNGDALDFVSAVGAFCLHICCSSPVFLTTSHKSSSSYQHNSQCTNEDVARLYEILDHCVQLEVCDPATLTAACRTLTSKTATNVMSNADAVDVLHVVTLCHKRRRVLIPNLDTLLLPIQAAKDLDSRRVLSVLSSLSRVHRGGGPNYSEVSKIISRRLGEKFRNSAEDHQKQYVVAGGLEGTVPRISNTEEFSNKDIVFALRTATLCEVATSFTAVSLEMCTQRSSTLSTEELGNVCKYLKHMHTSKSLGHITRSTCGKETRRLIPRLLTRTNELLGTFSLRDARHVLECFDAFQQRHSVIFSQLTPFVSGGLR